MNWEAVFDLPEVKKNIADIEEQMQAPEVYSNREKSQELGRKLKICRTLLADYNRIKSKLDDSITLIELAEEAEDQDMESEIQTDLEETRECFDQFVLHQTLSGENDLNNCFLTIHPGAGGTESCDWAQMLLRMYIRWVEKNGYDYDTIEVQPGDEAGIKSATLHVKGEYAFGYLKAEKGVHRLVRISPFDSNKRRHTSFSAIFVMPEIDDDIDVEIDEKDLKIDTYRSSGAGGQHVNVTDSAVRITHHPTGIVVSCQNERSQHKNRATAMKILRARIYEYYLKEKEKELENLAGDKKNIAWGNQIRSYVFHPYNMVKDHRTDKETGNIQAVMDGEIDDFIQAYLTNFQGNSR